MPAGRVRVAILSIEGTNCDLEVRVACQRVGARAEIVHLKQFEGRDVSPRERRALDDYDLLLIPGGFSAGDYVRAGAIFASRIRAAIGPELERFLASGRYLGGICNGFQTLVELGLLPGRDSGRLGPPEACLLPNDSGHFECRPTYIRWDGGAFAPFRGSPAGTTWLAPSAHAEGKLVLDGAGEGRLAELSARGQILFRWADPGGREAGYPWNPNGSPGNIAGITNRTGNVFGLMPHPERAFFRLQAPDWTRAPRRRGSFGDGHAFYAAIVDHLAHSR